MGDDISQALAAWMKLHDKKLDKDEAALGKGFLGSLILEKVFEDGSCLRWSEKLGRWLSYDTPEALAWARATGRC